MKLKCCYLTIFYQQDKVFATNAVCGKKRRSPFDEKPSRKPALFYTHFLTSFPKITSKCLTNNYDCV